MAPISERRAWGVTKPAATAKGAVPQFSYADQGEVKGLL